MSNASKSGRSAARIRSGHQSHRHGCDRGYRRPASTSGGAAADKNFDEVNVDGTSLDDKIKIASVGSQVVVSGLSAQVSVVHADKTDILDIFGGAGNDTIDASKLAAGKLALQLFGSIGADTLIGGAGGNDYVVGGDGNDLTLLGAGNDFFDWNLGDDNDTVEGQAGMDTARFNGDAGPAEVFELAADERARCSVRHGRQRQNGFELRRTTSGSTPGEAPMPSP